MQSQETQILSWKDHIRKRPQMYIGDLRLTGFNEMLRFLFEDILKDGIGNPIFEIDFFKGNKFAIKIFNVDTKRNLLKLHDLQTTNDSIANLGFGVLIALSAEISIAINDHPTLVVLFGQSGDFNIVASTSQEREKNVVISFTTDKEIFRDFEVVYEQVNNFLRQFAYLNPTLKIISVDKTTGELQRNVFYYPKGVFNQLDYFIAQQPYGTPSMRLEIDSPINEYYCRIGISYSSIWLDKSFIKTYAGNIETYLGGSFHDGIIEGLILSINAIAKKGKVDIVINRKLVKEQLIVIAAIRGDEFLFAGSVKRELNMPWLKKAVKQLVYERLMSYFNSNPKSVENILRKFKRWE